MKPHLGILVECQQFGDRGIRVETGFKIKTTRQLAADLLDKSDTGDPNVWVEILEYESCPRHDSSMANHMIETRNVLSSQKRDLVTDLPSYES